MKPEELLIEIKTYHLLQEIANSLKSIDGKEVQEFPEQKETDMTETNTLLKQLIEKENEDISITLTLT